MYVEPDVGWRFFRQSPFGKFADVVHVAVRIHREDDPGLALVDERADRLVGRVVLGQDPQQVQRLLDGQPLAGVMKGVDEDLGLVLVLGDVVGDLGDPDVAAAVARADRADLDELRVGRLGGVDLRDHLGVGVVAAVVGGIVGLRRRGAGDEPGEQGDREGGRDEGGSAGEGRHGGKGGRTGPRAQPADRGGPAGRWGHRPRRPVTPTGGLGRPGWPVGCRTLGAEPRPVERRRRGGRGD